MKSKVAELTKLAESYVKIANLNQIKSGTELSKLTFKLREENDEIIYLSVANKSGDEKDFVPSPIAKQKDYAWIKSQEILDTRNHAEGFCSLWIEERGTTTTIVIKQSIVIDGVRYKNILFSQVI